MTLYRSPLLNRWAVWSGNRCIAVSEWSYREELSSYGDDLRLPTLPWSCPIMTSPTHAYSVDGEVRYRETACQGTRLGKGSRRRKPSPTTDPWLDQAQGPV